MHRWIDKLTYIHTCMHLNKHTCMRIHIHTYIHTHTHTHTHTYDVNLTIFDFRSMPPDLTKPMRKPDITGS